MRRDTKALIIALTLCSFILLLTPLVISAPTKFTTVNDNGCEISPISRDYLKVNQNFDFNFHVFNTSNGAPLSNTTVSCYFHFYNQTGDHSYTSMLKQDPYQEHYVINEFAERMNGKNISKIGYYAYLVQCNGTNLGCAAKNVFIVTGNGEDLTMSAILIEPGLLLLISLIFLVTGITFNNKKWVIKMVLFLVSVLFIIMAINSGIGYMQNDTGLSMLNSGFIVVVSSVSLLFIVLIVYYLKSLAQAMKDVKSEKKEDLL